MAYSTQALLEAAVGGAAALNRIADPTNAASQTAATIALIAACIADADALIDTYANDTPGTTGTAGAMWATTPAPAIRASVAIALYKVYVRAEVADVPKWVADDYHLYVGPEGKTNDGILGLLAAGKVSWVPSEAPAQQNVGRVTHVSTYDEPRTGGTRRAKRYHTDLL